MEEDYEVTLTVKVSAGSEYTALMAGCLDMLEKLRTMKPEDLQTTVKLAPRWIGREKSMGDMT